MIWPEIPILDEARCSGCGYCTLVCPVLCLEMAGTIPWLPRPALCISCELCVIICPGGALRMGSNGEGK